MQTNSYYALMNGGLTKSNFKVYSIWLNEVVFIFIAIINDKKLACVIRN